MPMDSDIDTMNKIKNVSKVDKIINEIIKGINIGETIVFCGAGISKDSGLPVAKEFVSYVLEKLEVPKKDIKLILDKNSDPKIPFEAFVQTLQNDSKVDEIFNIYNQGKPNTNHILLANLIKARKVKTIVTTNFDKLIEKALGMEPRVLIEGKDYDVIYTEEDFKNINNWPKDHVRIIKIHGSIDNKKAMAITLKQVASVIFSAPRKEIIENVFSKGKHKNVLVLGYSSSDVFDISPQIQAIKKNRKKVYYIQHADNPKVEEIQERNDKNPFKKFKGSQRIYYNTRQLIKKIWKSIVDKQEPYKQKTSQTNWEKNVDEWYERAMKESTEAIRYGIPANIYTEMGIYKTALKYYELATKIAKEIGDKQGEGRWLGNLAITYSNIGGYKKTIECFEQALNIARIIGDKNSKGKWLGNLGSAYGRIGEYRKAIKYFNQALNIARRIRDKNSEGKWLGNLGVIYGSLGKFKKEIKYCKLTIGIAKKIGDKQGEGAWFGNTGAAYQSFGNYRKAIEYYKQALKIVQEIGNKRGEGRWLGNLGNAYRNIKKYKKAIEYLTEARKISKEFGDKGGEGLCLGDIGKTYQNIGENKKAIKYYTQALRIAQEIDDKRNEGLWLGNLGGAYQSLREYKKAIKCYKQALNLLKKILGSNHQHIKTIENNLRIALPKVSEIRP